MADGIIIWVSYGFLEILNSQIFLTEFQQMIIILYLFLFFL